MSASTVRSGPCESPAPHGRLDEGGAGSLTVLLILIAIGTCTAAPADVAAEVSAGSFCYEDFGASRWAPPPGADGHPVMFGAGNDGMHDFGYPCSLPHTISIEGLFVDDA
jgi:hypothetical protein